MPTENLIVSAIFFLYAALAILKPDWLVKWQIWMNKKILGATFTPSQRTYQVYRGMGVLFACIAVLIIFGVLK